MNQQQYDAIKQAAYNDELQKMASGLHPANLAGSIVKGYRKATEAISRVVDDVSGAAQKVPAATKGIPGRLKGTADAESEIARVNYRMGRDGKLSNNDMKIYLSEDRALAAKRKQNH